MVARERESKAIESGFSVSADAFEAVKCVPTMAGTAMSSVKCSVKNSTGMYQLNDHSESIADAPAAGDNVSCHSAQ